MIIIDTNLMFGVPCYINEAIPFDRKNLVPVSTIVASLDEGMKIEEIGAEYNIPEHSFEEIFRYISEK